MVRSAFSVSSCVVAAVLLSSSAEASIYNGLGGLIPDSPESGQAGSATFVINIVDSGVVGSFNSVTLNSLAHAFLGDLVATLEAPDGTSVTLFSRIGKTNPDVGFGDSSNFLGDYSFRDGGASLWAAAQSVNGSTVVAPGNYFASAPLTGAAINLQSAFAGRSITGTWKLTIADFGAGEAGAFAGWSLDMSVVPTPGALVALVAGGLFNRRRRSRS